jgi:hypothetical protein
MKSTPHPLGNEGGGNAGMIEELRLKVLNAPILLANQEIGE